MFEKKCKKCGKEFQISKEEKGFYEKISPEIGDSKKFLVPAPKTCFKCRVKQMLVFRNERKLYHRKCDFTEKPMISMFSNSYSGKVYERDIWWSDEWDPLEYGRNYDFLRGFFEQFAELLRAVPMFNLVQDGTSENCDYTNFGSYNKNCYLSLAYKCENVYYSVAIGCRDCVDGFYITSCELVYSSLDCLNCYNSSFLQNCTDCQDSWFLEDCIGCKNCVGSKNLRNCQFYIFNKPYSEKEYFRILKSFRLDSWSGVQKFEKKFKEFTKDLPNLNLQQKRSENSLGSYLDGAKNCQNCFQIVGGAEDCWNCFGTGIQTNDLIDCVYTSGSFCCGSEGLLNSQNCYFSVHTRNTNNLFYSHYCYNVEHCFGCVGLRNKKYCIFNQQFERGEYFEIVGRIIEAMIESGEWGEFFPVELSPFAYNESAAAYYFPLNAADAVVFGSGWVEEEIGNKYRGESFELPDSVLEIKDEVNKIPEKILICEETNKNYKIQKSELDFYLKMGLPLPRLCPDQRYLNLVAKRPGFDLVERKCDKCGKVIVTNFSEDSKDSGKCLESDNSEKFEYTKRFKESKKIVYCEKCYFDEVY